VDENLDDELAQEGAANYLNRALRLPQPAGTMNWQGSNVALQYGRKQGGSGAIYTSASTLSKTS
jgi:hypothetical protein